MTRCHCPNCSTPHEAPYDDRTAEIAELRALLSRCWPYVEVAYDHGDSDERKVALELIRDIGRAGLVLAPFDIEGQPTWRR